MRPSLALLRVLASIMSLAIVQEHLLLPAPAATSSLPTSRTSPSFSAAAPVQNNKVSNLLSSDMTVLLNGNSVELKKKDQRIAKGLGFGYKVVGECLIGKVFFYGGARIKENLTVKPDQVTLTTGEKFIGEHCGIGKEDLVIRRQEETVAIPLHRIESIDSARCQDFVLPITARSFSSLKPNLIKLSAKVGKASFWEEVRTPDWFAPLRSSLGALKKEVAPAKKIQPLICFADDVEGEALAVLIINQLKNDARDSVVKLQEKEKSSGWRVLPKQATPPGPNVRLPEHWWYAPRLTAGLKGVFVIDASKFQPVPLDLWSLELRQRFPQLPLLPVGAKRVQPSPIRLATGWTFAPVNNASSKQFVEFITANFNKIDANGDHFITKDEAARAVTNPDFKARDAIFVTTLYQGVTALEEFHNDEFLDENDGVTVDDLTGSEASPSRKITGILTGLRQSYNVATTRDVFTSDEPSTAGVSQGYLNTCYFQAVAAGTASMSPAVIQSMIEEVGSFPVGERKFRVTMPGTGPIVVSEPTDGELSVYARGTANGIWLAILEKAYANWAAPPGIGLCPQEALQGGSSDGGGFRAILGGGFTAVEPGDPNSVHTALTNAFQTQHPVMFGVSGEGKVYSVSRGHLYAVTAYDPATQVVTMFNSLGEEPDSTTPFPVNHQGANDDGVFSVGLKDALSFVTHVQVSEKSTAEVIAIVKEMKGASEVAEPPPGHQPPTGVFVCYGKPPESDAIPEGHCPPEGTFVCYGSPPENATPEVESGHNPPEGFFVCYGSAPALQEDDPIPPTGGGHNPPDGTFVCYGSVPESKDAPPKDETVGHNPPPGTFVCYGTVPEAPAKNPPREEPKDKSPEGGTTSGGVPDIFIPIFQDPTQGWVNRYGMPCPPPGSRFTRKDPVKKSAPKTAEKDGQNGEGKDTETGGTTASSNSDDTTGGATRNPPKPIPHPSKPARGQFGVVPKDQVLEPVNDSRPTTKLEGPEDGKNTSSGDGTNGDTTASSKPDDTAGHQWNFNHGPRTNNESPPPNSDQLTPRLGLTYDIKKDGEGRSTGGRTDLEAFEAVRKNYPKEWTDPPQNPGASEAPNDGTTEHPNSTNGQPIAMVPPGVATSTTSGRTVELVEAQDKNQIEIGLECPPSGPNTLENLLTMRNLTQQSLKVEIGDWIFFIPQVKSLIKQILCKLPGTIVMIPPGEVLRMQIPTMCVSTKLEQPPGPAEEKVQYRIGPYPEPNVGETLIRIIKVAQQLEREGTYAEVGISPEKRWRKIAQMSIWKFLGEKTPRKEDDVSIASLKSDLLTGMGKREDELSSIQRKNFNTLLDALDSAIERTIREATK